MFKNIFKCVQCEEKNKYINNLEIEIKKLETLLNLYKTENKELKDKGLKFIEWQNKNKNPKPKLKINVNLILNLKAQGKSNRQIAEYLGVSEGTIRNRLKEHN